MGMNARRCTAIGAFTLAGALALGGVAASADVVDGSPIDIDGDPDVVSPEGAPAIFRFADADRVSTAVEAAERTDLPWGDTVIVANSEVFADALAASTLADVIDAPVLLNTPGDDVNEVVAEYLESEDFTDVIVLGGTDVFTADFLEDEAFEGSAVERIAGTNRYDTAIFLAEATESALEDEGATIENIFLASGTDFPDALTAGAAAAANNGVVLLTRGDEGLTLNTYQAVVQWTGEAPGQVSTAAIGGPAADAAAMGWSDNPVETDIDVVGDDRYETAVAVAEEFIEDAEHLVIASGENFPDAVVGGAYAANVDGALLLTRQSSLTNATGDYIESGLLSDVDAVFVFGGPDSVSRNVSEQIADLEWDF